MPKYTYDGFGINDAGDPYKKRVATINRQLAPEAREGQEPTTGG